MKKNLTIAGIVLGILLIFCIAAFFILKVPQKLGVLSSRLYTTDANAPDTGTEGAEAGAREWVPFVVDDSYGSSPLSGYNLKQKEVKSASARNAAATASDTDKLLETIKSKVPDYPFDEIPLLKPAMVVTAGQEPYDEDITMNVMYYTDATIEESLTFYRDTLKQYEGFKEELFDSSTGKTYDFSFIIKGKYEIDAGVMVMEMPETTGYTCALQNHVIIRGAAKVETVEVKNRADGLPGNYPDNLLPVFKLKEIFQAEGDSEGCYLQYYSSGSYKEAVVFFRSKLNDKSNFNENTETEGETIFSCLVPGWHIGVRVMDENDSSYIEAECYVN